MPSSRFWSAPGVAPSGPREVHRILVDHVADFWTVIFEAEFENLDDYVAAISAPEVRAAMEGYLDLVEGGHRRVYRVASVG